MGTYKTSAPAPVLVLVVFPRKTVVKAEDCEATRRLAFRGAPVPEITFAESEARNLEPLLNIVNWVAGAVEFADVGLEGEGRDVVTVSLAPVKAAALDLPTFTNSKVITKVRAIKIFLGLTNNNKCI